MPKLMEKADWMRTVENVSRGGGVWYENVNSRDGFPASPFPESGVYQVIFVKLEDAPAQKIPAKRKSARDMIGYGARFHELRTTEEWMKELREGEEV